MACDLAKIKKKLQFTGPEWSEGFHNIESSGTVFKVLSSEI